ncbi:hypothetical protein GCK72_015434 [Caenorhabditis remanei]|uniref:F-box domain-containing protein n=1 Tax=Caenorhabditis remanei TaxID=31234 RepID=A0A6A5GWG5_CAERE|nr:hypothetical protein GCK72_015434 [Caenorhabditis remanei]KAF1758974.1 hypothetical protein GCK72_015434 [Caenorhabditis remanei]
MDILKPFPILRLPFLALEEVFKAMVPFEIINFSIISKRAKAITKQMSFCPKYFIRLCIDETLVIEMHGTNRLVSCTYLMTSDKQMEGKIEEYGCDGYIVRRIYKYSTDPIEEWKQLSKHILEIFKKLTIDVLTLHMDALWEEEHDVDDHAAYLLSNFKVNNELNFYLDTKNVNFDGKIPKNLKELHILNSHWIGYEKLLKIDCEHVSLRNNQITNEEWNMFLKKWITMETNQNLEYLQFDYRELDGFRELVLHDIPHEVVDEGVERNLIIFPDETDEINGGIDIRRIDGKTATFFVQYNVFSMSVN